MKQQVIRGLAIAAMALACAAGQDARAKNWDERAREVSRKFLGGEFADALRLAERLAAETEVLPPDDPRRAMAAYYLGLNLHEAGRHFESAKALEKAARLQAGWSNGGGEAAVATWNQLGFVYTDLREYAKAERAIQEARNLLAKSDVALQSELARAELVEARILAGRGRGRDAEEVARRALKRAGLARNQQVYLWNLTGNILVNGRRWREAEEAYLQALDLSREIWGSEHPNTAKVLINLAGTSQRLGRAKDAELVAAQAAEMLERHLGANHPAVGAALLQRAAALRELKRGKEAKGVERKGSAILARYESENYVGMTVDVQALALRGKE